MRKSNKKFIKIIILFSIFNLITINNFIVDAESEAFAATVVKIEPSSISVLPNEDFSFDVKCIPGQSVKAFELKLSFNSSVLNVNSVSLGNFFKEFNNFSNLGTIDNTQGYVTDIYGLILGSGTVSDEGILISFNCTVNDLNSNSSSIIGLYDLGVTDDSSYISSISINGSIFVNISRSEPRILSPNPSDDSSDVEIGIGSLSVEINHPSGNMFNYTITTTPDVGSMLSNNQSNGTKNCIISDLEYSTTYTWTVEVNSGNSVVNESFSFTTEQEPEGDDDDDGGDVGGGSSPPVGGGFIPLPVETVEEFESDSENNTPVDVIDISGPIYIELGVSYSYEVSTFDIDGDKIRYKFDWGDGNFSNWTDYFESNQSVSQIYSWSICSEFEIKVIAEDETGLSSNWSYGKNVMVSKVEVDDEVEDNIEVNTSFIFDGEQKYSFDVCDLEIPEGSVIISYVWDFGDGAVYEGKNPDHVFEKPGEYIVTLNVYDSNGNNYTKTMKVSVSSEIANIVENEETINSNIAIFLSISIIVFSIVIFILFIVKRKFVFFSFLRKIK